MVNEHWGGPVHVLDTTQTEVLEHLEHVAPNARRRRVPLPEARLHVRARSRRAVRRRVADAGAARACRVRRDPSGRGRRRLHPRLRCAARCVHRCRRRHAHRTGCRAVVELRHRRRWSPPGYGETSPATAYTLAATKARQFMHRRLWLNDPDCVMLRTRADVAVGGGGAPLGDGGRRERRDGAGVRRSRRCSAAHERSLLRRGHRPRPRQRRRLPSSGDRLDVRAQQGAVELGVQARRPRAVRGARRVRRCGLRRPRGSGRRS